MKKSSTSYEKDTWIRYERCDSNTTGMFRYLVDDGDCIIGMDEDGVPKKYPKEVYAFSASIQVVPDVAADLVESKDNEPVIVLDAYKPSGQVAKYNFRIMSTDNDFNGWFKEDPDDEYKCLEMIEIMSKKIRIYLLKHRSDKPMDDKNRVGTGHSIERDQNIEKRFKTRIRFSPGLPGEKTKFGALWDYLWDKKGKNKYGRKCCKFGTGKFKGEPCGYIEFEDQTAVKHIKNKLEGLNQKKESSCA